MMTTGADREEGMIGAGRSQNWRWYICVLLLLGTVVNYMDRLTVNILAGRIKADFLLNNEQYGNLELGFGLAFAAGSLLFGWLVDRIGVYWLYPTVLVGWSAMGFLTGLSRSYEELLALRIFLGLFEAGHFPCGLKTIQVLLAPRDRALGCSLLQSGTALGAVIAPQAIRLLATDDPAGWRPPFLVIGAGGTVWVLFWLFSIRPRDLYIPEPLKPVEVVSNRDPSWAGLWKLVFSNQFLALMIMVICINLNWHLFRVWLPLFLQEARGYGESQMLNFATFYYIAADLGSIAAGFFSGYLARRGLSVYSSRMWVFGVCCLLTTLTTAAAFLPSGPLLLGALLAVAFGGLGSYTAYYAMTQDLSFAHQGKISGALATITWLVTASFHPIFGAYLDRTRNYDFVFGVMGWLPMVALVAILLLWNRGRGRLSRLDDPDPITADQPEPPVGSH
ncbi:MFS transporter [Tundrisphaera lichenicola]|uniref:MFS transporter n=1 Tax=Tundrisphaera lichenicola TaxID=2029860 RepID=UPI003EBBD1EF